ncbi:MAG TPA: nucleoid-structuring protein H-NS [Cyclobacteriaceae bacterium]|nr:nucleoid-structuring protein H-NS [Cyclobacteriaceae bacterium]
MMNSIRYSSKLVMLALLVTLFASGCKSRKKAMEASNAAAEKARIEQEAARKAEDQKMKEAAEAAERAQREAESRQSEVDTSAPKIKLSNYFNSIAGAGNTASANSSINEALSLFASPETPVLIVISESGGMKDYDKPTNIKNYLNYLKDQKKNINSISNLTTDGSGKITEVELKKN